MTAKLVALPGLKNAPRSAPKSRMDTMLITPDSVAKWRCPPFQRPLKTNRKVLELSEKLKTDGGIIPGIVTLGILDSQWYIVDGQHRMEAFRLADIKEGLVDVRIVEFETMTEMAEEFAQLNDSLVRLLPDDKLRALESALEPLQLIRKASKFVGYGNLRRGGGSVLVSMSAVLRLWAASSKEVPQSSNTNVVELAKEMSVEDAAALSEFLNTCYAAWGSDPEHSRLWGGLNMTILAWIWRRTVTGQYSSKTTKITKGQFLSCCMSLSASQQYLDWLVGRNGTRDRDRSPCYGRIRQIIQHRLTQDGLKKFYFPSPLWASTRSGGLSVTGVV